MNSQIIMGSDTICPGQFLSGNHTITSPGRIFELVTLQTIILAFCCKKLPNQTVVWAPPPQVEPEAPALPEWILGEAVTPKANVLAECCFLKLYQDTEIDLLDERLDYYFPIWVAYIVKRRRYSYLVRL